MDVIQNTFLKSGFMDDEVLGNNDKTVMIKKERAISLAQRGFRCQNVRI